MLPDNQIYSIKNALGANKHTVINILNHLRKKIPVTDASKDKLGVSVIVGEVARTPIPIRPFEYHRPLF